MTGQVTQGHRADSFKALFDGPPGGYMPASEEGWWWVRDPAGYIGQVSPDLHSIVVHEDGTITVSPSILGTHWHGFLERGVWREV